MTIYSPTPFTVRHLDLRPWSNLEMNWWQNLDYPNHSKHHTTPQKKCNVLTSCFVVSFSEWGFCMAGVCLAHPNYLSSNPKNIIKIAFLVNFVNRSTRGRFILSISNFGKKWKNHTVHQFQDRFHSFITSERIELDFRDVVFHKKGQNNCYSGVSKISKIDRNLTCKKKGNLGDFTSWIQWNYFYSYIFS